MTQESEPTSAGRYVLDFFPQEVNRLKQEIAHHPDLLERLAGQDNKDFYIQLAEIAAFCVVPLDGTYSPEEINKICDVCTRYLFERRTGIVSGRFH